MKPGFHAERVPSDIHGSPSLRVCDSMAALFANDGRLCLNVTLAVTPQSPKDIWVSMLHASHRHEGHGGRALDALAFLCDVHGVTIRLLAVALNETLRNPEGALDQQALESFYERRGFVADDANWRAFAMIRTPREQAARMPTSKPCTAPRELQRLHSILGTPMIQWKRNSG